MAKEYKQDWIGQGFHGFPLFNFDRLMWLNRGNDVSILFSIRLLHCLGVLMQLRVATFFCSFVSDATLGGPQPPQGPSQTSQKLNRRFADPSIVNISNATMSSAAAQQFQTVWNEAKELRRVRPITDDDLSNWWESLSEQLQVAPVSATSCAQPHHCVGVTLPGHDCICKPLEKVMNVEIESFMV